MTFTHLIALFRPRTLIAAFAPLLLGAAFSYYTFLPIQPLSLSIGQTFLILLVVLLAQIVANMWNEYCDFKSGLDYGQTIGNAGSIVSGSINPRTILNYIKVFSGIAFLIGLYLAMTITFWYIPAGIFCILISFCYSGGPFPISRTPFGEIASGLAMGFSIVMITAYAWVHELSLALLIPAIPSTALVAMIMLTNNIRDINNDQSHGRRTLPIILGRQRAINLMEIIFFFVCFWIIAWVYIHMLPILSLITLLSIIPALKSIHILNTYSDTANLDKAMSFTVKATMLYHLVLSLSLIISELI